MNAITTKLGPEKAKIATDRIVNMNLHLSLVRADLATCPPSSMAAGSRFSIVTTIPAQPAHAMGFRAYPLLGAVIWGIKFRLFRAGRRTYIQLIGTKGRVPEPVGILIGTNVIKPIMLKTSATMKPASGPLEPMSKRASRLAGQDFCMITAPRVPSGGGPGMK